jgi:hypothetical protein
VICGRAACGGLALLVPLRATPEARFAVSAFGHDPSRGPRSDIGASCRNGIGRLIHMAGWLPDTVAAPAGTAVLFFSDVLLCTRYSGVKDCAAPPIFSPPAAGRL